MTTRKLVEHERVLIKFLAMRAELNNFINLDTEEVIDLKDGTGGVKSAYRVGTASQVVSTCAYDDDDGFPIIVDMLSDGDGRFAGLKYRKPNYSEIVKIPHSESMLYEMLGL
jgi:hypothetical protein